MVQRAKHILGIWESWAPVLLSAFTPFVAISLSTWYTECIVNSSVMKILPQQPYYTALLSSRWVSLSLSKQTRNMDLYSHLLSFSIFECVSPFIYYFSTYTVFVTFSFIMPEPHLAGICFAKAGTLTLIIMQLSAWVHPRKLLRVLFQTALLSI